MHTEQLPTHLFFIFYTNIKYTSARSTFNVHELKNKSENGFGNMAAKTSIVKTFLTEVPPLIMICVVAVDELVFVGLDSQGVCRSRIHMRFCVL